MHYPNSEKLKIYANAIHQFIKLEPRHDKRIKYLDFIDIYSKLNDNEIQQYQQQYRTEANKMSAFADRFIAQGLEQGLEKGLEQGLEESITGKQELLSKMAQLRFPKLSKKQFTQHIQHLSSAEQLEHAVELIMNSQTFEQLLIALREGDNFKS